MAYGLERLHVKFSGEIWPSQVRFFRFSHKSLREGAAGSLTECVFFLFVFNFDKPQPQTSEGQQASRNLLGPAWVLVVVGDHLTRDHLNCDGLQLSLTLSGT